MLGKVLVLFAALSTIGILVVWIIHGKQTFSKDKVQVVTKKMNDFGIEDEYIEWKDEFRLGLDYAVPAVGVALILGGVGLVMIIRQRRKLQESTDFTNH